MSHSFGSPHQPQIKPIPFTTKPIAPKIVLPLLTLKVPASKQLYSVYIYYFLLYVTGVYAIWFLGKEKGFNMGKVWFGGYITIILYQKTKIQPSTCHDTNHYMVLFEQVLH